MKDFFMTAGATLCLCPQQKYKFWRTHCSNQMDRRWDLGRHMGLPERTGHEPALIKANRNLQLYHMGNAEFNCFFLK